MTTTQTNTETIFVNLFKAIKAERAKRLQDFINEVNEETSIETFTQRYGRYSDLIPASRKGYLWTLEGIREYLIARKIKVNEKGVAKELLHLQTVEKSADLESITVGIEWKKSRMWGNNPTANARVCDKEYGHDYTGSASGCGYDKESAAVAEAINQSNSFLKAMYLVKEKHPKAVNHELFGYGSGYGILPRLEGGVGVSCYRQIFEKIGFKWANTASGKTFDVYTASPLK